MNAPAATNSTAAVDSGDAGPTYVAGLMGSGGSSGHVQPQVYAYLPVRAYGLRFALQADWLLPASREDVLEGEAWNQLLREQASAQ
jgi:hypothetical protein